MAVVGAGVSGLAAARRLQSSGREVVVFEKSCHVGGRVSTRRQDGYIYDTGASSIAPRGKLLEAVLQTLGDHGLARIEHPIYTLKNLRVEPGDPLKMRIERYAFTGGNQTLCEVLADGLEVRLTTPVVAIERDQTAFRVNEERFDAVVLTPPAPQSMRFLEALGESRALGHVRYRACLAIFIAFDRELPLLAYHGLIEPEQRHPLTWISVESQKTTGRVPPGQTGIMAQLSPEYSRSHFETEDSVVVADTLGYLSRLYGSSLGSPVFHDVKRWKYSLPESIAMFESANPLGTRLLVAGDSLLGGRVELAYETGVLAAERLINEP